jgi:hypothetical protein
VFFLTLFVACSSHKNSKTLENPFTQIPNQSFWQGENLQKHQLRIFYQGNMKAELGTCGCAFQPSGGVDRKYNFLKSLKSSFVLLDSGNNFFPSLNIQSSDELKAIEKAISLGKAHKILGVVAQNVGRFDLALGVDKLKLIQEKTKIELISSNLVNEKNESVFSPFKNINLESDVTLTVVGVTNFGEDELSLKNYRILPPKIQVIEMAKKIPQNNLLVVLSDLNAVENSDLARSIERPMLIIGSSGYDSYRIPVQENKSIIMQTLPLGQELGQIEFYWKSDALSWFNQSAKAGYLKRWDEIVSEKKYFEAFPNSTDKEIEIKKNKEDLENLKKLLPLQSPYITFITDLILMDSRWAKNNELSKIIKKFK